MMKHDQKVTVELGAGAFLTCSLDLIFFFTLRIIKEAASRSEPAESILGHSDAGAYPWHS